MARLGKVWIYFLIAALTPVLIANKVEHSESVEQGPRTLRQAYKDYFPIGCAVTPEKDLKDPQTADFISKQYSSLTSKKSMQPMWIQPQEGKFRWTEADQLVAFAQKNNMKVRGHCLIYYRHMPAWFFKDGKEQASRELVLKRMKDHITAVVSRYRGKVYCWDVVNEAINNQKDGFYQPNDMLYKIVGEDYIAKAFEYAHAADPDARLFYNNDCLTQSYRRDKIRTLLKGLLDKGVPVHGMGIQGHLGVNGIPVQALQDNVDAFSSLGLEVQFTEVDVSIYKKGLKREQLVAASDDYTSEVLASQINTYSKIFSVSRKNKGKVTGITMWGFADGSTPKTGRVIKKNYPFLFDADLKPKEGYSKIVNF